MSNPITLLIAIQAAEKELARSTRLRQEIASLNTELWKLVGLLAPEVKSPHQHHRKEIEK